MSFTPCALTSSSLHAAARMIMELTSSPLLQRSATVCGWLPASAGPSAAASRPFSSAARHRVFAAQRSSLRS
jgi:hypothetical protein